MRLVRSPPVQTSTHSEQSSQRGASNQRADRSRAFKRLLPPWGTTKGRSASAKRARHNWGSAFLGSRPTVSSHEQLRQHGSASHTLPQATSKATAGSSTVNSSANGGVAEPVLSSALLQQLQQLPHHELLIQLAQRGLALQADVLLATSMQLSLTRCCTLVALATSPGYRQMNSCSGSDAHSGKAMAPAGHRPATRSKPGRSPPAAHQAERQLASDQPPISGQLPCLSDQPPLSVPLSAPATALELDAGPAATAAAFLPACDPLQTNVAGPSHSGAAMSSRPSSVQPLLPDPAMPAAPQSAALPHTGPCASLQTQSAAVVSADPLGRLPAEPCTIPAAEPLAEAIVAPCAERLAAPSSTAALPASVQPADPPGQSTAALTPASAAAGPLAPFASFSMQSPALAASSSKPLHCVTIPTSSAAAALPNSPPELSKRAGLPGASSTGIPQLPAQLPAQLPQEVPELAATASAEAVTSAATCKASSAMELGHSAVEPGQTSSSEQQLDEVRSIASQHPKPPLAPIGSATAASRVSRPFFLVIMFHAVSGSMYSLCTALCTSQAIVKQASSIILPAETILLLRYVSSSRSFNMCVCLCTGQREVAQWRVSYTKTPATHQICQARWRSSPVKASCEQLPPAGRCCTQH